ncbi:hypothetical protein ACJJTC_002885 [Scirpophaga incertulas]
MRSYILFAFIFVVCANYGDGKFFRNDYKYSEEAGGWLKLHKIPATWSEARLMCKYEGAVLASPLNENLKEAIFNIMKEFETTRIYTGIHSFSNGIFTSIEGVPMEEIPVIIGDYGSPDVFTCSLFSGEYFTLSHCHELLNYICYKKDDNAMNINACGPNMYGYKYNERTGSCYKMHTTGRTWRRGYQTCAAEQGYPVIINSLTEAQVIKELFAAYPENTILANFTHVASIGALDWGERGSWWTVHGDTLEEAGYAEWEGGKPDSSTQYCVGVNRSGKLNDIWCDRHTFAVICEKAPLNYQDQPIASTNQ